MGNGNSVRIQSDRAVYQGGETVTGNIYLTVVQPFQSNGVYLRVKGVERVEWHEQRTRTVGTGENRKTETYTEHISKQHTFFKVENRVYVFQGYTVPGQYALPFNFVLPYGLPGSYFENGLPRSGKATRFYKIKSLVHVQGMFKSNIKHTQFLNINQTLNKAIVDQQSEDTKPVKVWCCINKGHVFMRMKLNKDCYVPGEVSNIICEAQNQSSVDIKVMKIKLRRDFKMNSGGDRYHHNYTVNEMASQGLEPFTEFMADKAKYIQFPLVGNTQITPSTDGLLFQNTYYIQMTLSVPCGFDCRVELPVVIYPPQIAQWAPLVVEQPANWNPQLLPVASFSLPPLTGIPQQMPPPQYQQQMPPQQYQQQMPPQQYQQQMPPQQYQQQMPPQQYQQPPQPSLQYQQPYPTQPYQQQLNAPLLSQNQ